MLRVVARFPGSGGNFEEAYFITSAMGVRTVQLHRAARARVAHRPAVSHNEGVRKRPRKGARRPTADSLVFSFLSAADVVEARLETALSPTGLSLAKLAVLHFLADAKIGRAHV